MVVRLRTNQFYRNPWFILVVILLASVAAPLNQFKVPPLLPLLMDFFHQPVGKAGLLMSIFAITGLILALPAGFISHRLGHRTTGLIALTTLVLGALLGAFSQSIGTMLASRFIEGAGMGLMAVVAPAIIALQFTDEQRGKAMGIWAIWAPIGSMAMFLLAPSLASLWDWQSVWWFGCFYSLFVGLLFFLFIQPSSGSFLNLKNSESFKPLSRPALKRALRNRDLWLIGILFACFTFNAYAFSTWTPTFLHGVHKVPLSKASMIMGISPMLLLVSCPLAGWLSDRIRSRKATCVLPMMVMAFLYPLASILKTESFLPLVITLGLLNGAIPACVFAAGIEAVGDERLGGMAMAVVMMGQNLGMLLGPIVFGWIVESTGSWSVAFWGLAPISLIGAVLGWVAKMDAADHSPSHLAEKR